MAFQVIFINYKNLETPGKSLSWTDVLMYPFPVRYFVTRDVMTEKNIYVSTFESEIGRSWFILVQFCALEIYKSSRHLLLTDLMVL